MKLQLHSFETQSYCGESLCRPHEIGGFCSVEIFLLISVGNFTTKFSGYELALQNRKNMTKQCRFCANLCFIH
jgi:hypothetical protein